jgi:hypothetical protein
VAGYLESLLLSLHNRQQYAHNIKFPLFHTEKTTSDVEAQKPTNHYRTPRIRKHTPASPLRRAFRVLREARTKHFVNFVDSEKQNRCHTPIKASSAIPFRIEIGTLSGRAPSQCPAVTSLLTAQDNLDGIVYPVSQVQSIDQICDSDFHNLINMRPLKEPPPAHTTIDPC